MRIALKTDDLSAIHKFLEQVQCEELKHPLLEFCQNLPPEEQYRICLLGVSLYQNIRWHQMMPYFISLYQTFLQKLWSVPALTLSEIETHFEQFEHIQNWSQREFVPGIIWSVGDFIRQKSTLIDWLKQTPPQKVIQNLHTQIFFFGKNNPMQRKARTWISLIFGAQPPAIWQEMLLAPTRAAFSSMSFVGLHKAIKICENNPKEILSLYKAYLSAIHQAFPQFSHWQIHQSLYFFGGKEPTSLEWKIQKWII